MALFMLAPVNTTEIQEHVALNRELLLVYAIYRLSLTLIFWMLFSTDTAVGQDQPGLFVSTALIYLLINAALLYASTTKWQPRFLALFIIVASDIVAIQLIAQTSGDISSGLSVLMVVSVAAGSLFLQSNKAFLVPSFASITLLLSVGASVLHHSAADQKSINYSEIVASGWLGMLFFLASALVSYLSARVEKSDLRARQEHEHAQNLQRLNSLIIDRMQTGILIVDTHGSLISHNQAASELLQIYPEKKISALKQIDPRLQEFLGSIISATAHNVSTKSVIAGNLDDPVHLNPITLHLDYSGKSLKFIWINLKDANNTEYLVFIEDLSKIAQQAQQLKLSSLGKLTASIAHEIRNPLGAASHAAQLLQDTESKNETARLAEIVVNQTRRCSDVIESVLGVSRGGSSNIQQFDLVSWLPNFLNDYQIGKECEIEFAGEPVLNIRFDQSQLAQILGNLLDNALRYSEQGSGQRCAAIYASIDSLQRPQLDILDNGSGVASDDIDSLFEPFFTRSKQGSGLGLYICRELCEANQATVTYIRQPYGKNRILTESISAKCSLEHCFRIQFAHPNRTAIFSSSHSVAGY